MKHGVDYKCLTCHGEYMFTTTFRCRQEAWGSVEETYNTFSLIKMYSITYE